MEDLQGSEDAVGVLAGVLRTLYTESIGESGTLSPPISLSCKNFDMAVMTIRKSVFAEWNALTK
jgi:hypothetical protein